MRPTVVIVASGSTPRALPIPMTGTPSCVWSVPDAIDQAFAGASPETAIVIDGVGHMPAYVPAELFADRGTDVTIVSAAPVLGWAMEETTQGRTLRRLAKKGVTFRTAAKPTGIADRILTVTDVWSGREDSIAAPVVIAAIPNVATDGLATELEALMCEVRVIGDALAPRTLLEAVREGHLTGTSI